MPYIGNPAVDRFTATKAASVYSGDGSTVAFTLENSVGADEDILVSVDGVVQEPSVAYAVSSGTTLTFTAAPSSNSGNNIFVYYLFTTIGTVTHPATSALSATSGTFSTTLASTGNATVGGTFASTGNATVGGTFGVTGATTLTGATALGNTGSTVKSEGGAVTTNIAQGLAKHFTVFKGTDTFAGIDSFNQSAIADVSSGLHRTSFTTNFGSINYAVTGSIIGSTSGGYYAWVASDGGVKVTSSVDTLTVNGEGNMSLYDMDVVQLVSHGDLA